MRQRTFGVLFVVAVLLVGPQGRAQDSVAVRVRAVLIDGELNQKAVPRMAVALVATEPLPASVTLTTDFEGVAEAQVKPGKYRVMTPNGIDFVGTRYTWDFEVDVPKSGTTIVLSNDNAQAARNAAPRKADEDLPTLFKRLQNAVVTVFSETAHGTGFLIGDGLILTNEHVVGRSSYLAVQFDPDRKIAATLLAGDPQKDVAVLWADFTGIPEASPVSLATGSAFSLEEGDRVFTIGSPLNQRKVITSGLASKIEERAIISDININPGNSGGPLFSGRGTVVGITTFGDSTRRGPGISGIIRIDQAMPLIEAAKAARGSAKVPSAEFLRVEPRGSYPLDSLKASISAEKFDRRPYVFSAGDYDIAVMTPVLIYREQFDIQMRAAKEKSARNRRQPAAVQGTFQPLEELRDWGEYVGQYKPVVHVLVKPKLSETFWSAFGRGLVAGAAAYGGTYATLPPAKMRFKNDFYRMTLLCGGREVEPIHPGKIEQVVDVQDFAVNATDATYAGHYIYAADSIRPECGSVTLKIYSERKPAVPLVVSLSPRTVKQVAVDFAPVVQPQGTSRAAIDTASERAVDPQKGAQVDSLQHLIRPGMNVADVVSIAGQPSSRDVRVEGGHTTVLLVYRQSTGSTVVVEAKDGNVTAVRQQK